MRIVLEETNSEEKRRVTVETLRDDLKVREVLELVYRLMLAQSFTEESIRKYLNVDLLINEPVFIPADCLSPEQFEALTRRT